MRTSPIHIALSLVLSLGACAVPVEEGEIATLENAAGKEDGYGEQVVTVSSAQPSGAMRLKCDEWWLDRCEVVLRVRTDMPTRHGAAEHLAMVRRWEVDVAAIHVYQPDGSLAELSLREGDDETPSDVVRLWGYVYQTDDGSEVVGTNHEGELEHPGQFRVRSWQKGEYRVEIDHLALPAPVPDERTFTISASWE